MIHLFSFLCPHPPISCYRWLALHKSASAGDLFLLNGSSSSHCHQLLFKVDWLTDLILLPESNSYELLLQKQNWIGRFLKATIRKTALCLQVWNVQLKEPQSYCMYVSNYFMVLLLEPGIPGSCGEAARVEHHSTNVCKECIQGFSLHHKSNCNVQDAFGILGIWSETSLSWSLWSDSKSQCCLALGSKGSSLFGGCVCRHAHGAITVTFPWGV